MYGYKLAPLLDDGVPILIYNGDKDYICNWVGGLAWVSALEWTGKKHFVNAHNKPWQTTEGKPGGESKSFGPLTFMRVFDAGHMVPMD
jgi:cathepsin A (carboxypeptidase C)